jgi:hypothetical protein
MVHNQARDVDNAAGDEATEYPIFCHDQTRDPVRHVPRGKQGSEHCEYHECIAHGLRAPCGLLSIRCAPPRSIFPKNLRQRARDLPPPLVDELKASSFYVLMRIRNLIRYPGSKPRASAMSRGDRSPVAPTRRPRLRGYGRHGDELCTGAP